MTTYAVTWREPDGQRFVGGLALGPCAFRLEGRPRGPEGAPVERRFPYGELRGLRVGSCCAERLDGRPALVVERRDGTYLVADAGMGAPVVHELIERVVELRGVAGRRATVVVPLKEGALERVRELVAQGPPFDPVGTGLTRHEVLLTPHEAIFVFETETEDGVRVLMRQLDLRAAAASWSEVLAGPPRLAGVAYAWERPEPLLVSAAGVTRSARPEDPCPTP